jgi:hypothetical protein
MTGTSGSYTSRNPSLAQLSGSWNSAQASAATYVSRPVSPEVLRRVINSVSGGTINAPKMSKIPDLKNTLDSRVFNKNTIMADKTDLSKYSWNLPPHQWSRPVDPSQYDNIIADAQGWDKASNPVNRRGRIYWYSRVDTAVTDSKSKNYGTSSDPRYGFQFIWNPESFSTGVSVNLDITPTAKDKFTKVVGAFPSGESLSVAVLLDRTNDMYCLRSHNSSTASFVTNYDSFYEFYRGHSFEDFTSGKASRESFSKKISELQTLGTIADVEYLYKAINGPGWKNPASGRETSDIGFLSPTLLKVEIGPLSYVGYISSISVNHTSFTKGMIPIRSVVNISFNLMATAGIASGGELVSQ